MKVKIYLRRICLTGIWIGQIKSFKMENLLQSIHYVMQNFLDTFGISEVCGKYVSAISNEND